MFSDRRTQEALAYILSDGTQDPTDNKEEKEADERRNAAKRAKEEAARKQEEDETAKKAAMSPEQIAAEELKLKANELYKSRKFDEALIEYAKCIELYPKEISYHLNRAAVYLEMGEFDMCIAECQDVLNRKSELGADFSSISKAFCRMAVCYERQKDYGKACEMYEKALVEDNTRQTRIALKAAKEKNW
eukprot:GHVN01024210.1.p1 GENE.GHVN01024210.1~~GHVN01024210.1.p1  ORF type:complete len:190 (+),score=46.51 GHVN01024210.1:334-903(+)